jgi:hypothetical protein
MPRVEHDAVAQLLGMELAAIVRLRGNADGTLGHGHWFGYAKQRRASGAPDLEVKSD